MNEIYQICKICGRIFTSRKDITATDLDNPEKAVYHESMGMVCLKHKGVKEEYNRLLNLKAKEMEVGSEVTGITWFGYLTGDMWEND